jgi:hypothetical protein
MLKSSLLVAGLLFLAASDGARADSHAGNRASD